MRFSFACKTSHKAIPCLLAALALLSACATTPRELGSEPIQLRIDSRTVADLSALEPRLVHYSDKRTLLRLAPTEAWRVPRMRTPELQEMVAHCDANGRQVLQLQRAVLRDGAGEVLATFVADGRQPLTSLEQYASLRGLYRRPPEGSVAGADGGAGCLPRPAAGGSPARLP